MLIIFLLLYLNFRRLTETLIVMLSVPCPGRRVWLMWLLGYNMSRWPWPWASSPGGVAAETGVVMLIYFDHAWEEIQAKRRAENKVPGG